MISRNKALDLLKKYIKTENTIKHMIATEAIMRALAERFDPEHVDEWGMAGLLHDIDYEAIDQKTYKNHGKKSVEILKKEKAGLPDSVYQAILAHVADYYDNVQAETKMDWSIYICDSLTGLIVATALVMDGKLENVETQNVLNRFEEKNFAAGCRREDIQKCDELGFSLEEFVEINLKAMKSISEELGL